MPARLEGELGGPALRRGHALRDGDLDARRAALATAPSRAVDVAILGAGAAGLSAGWRLRRKGFAGRLALVELEEATGGTARGGVLQHAGRRYRHPLGAHYLPLPGEANVPLRTLLGELGALDGDGRPAEHLLVRAPQERIFHRGFWYPGDYPYAGASAEDLAELGRFEALVERYVGLRDGAGRRAFSLPLRTSSDDAELLALDRVDAETFLASRGFRSPRLHWLCDHACRDDYGLGLGATSAWALLFYFAARVPRPGSASAPFLTWPDGNAPLVEHLEQAVQGDLRVGALAFDVRSMDDGDEDPGTVRIGLVDAAGDVSALRARRVIVALPRFIARRVVPALAEREAADPTAARDAFRYGPWVVANLALRDRPRGRGAPPAWDNVIYGSPSLGYVSATHQRGRDHGPTVWTWYYALAGADERAERERLEAATFEDWAQVILSDLTPAHPDLAAQVARVDVWRWGHAMVQPRVGFLEGGKRQHRAAPLGAIHFAHSDLSGVALFEEAFDQGVRAADEVLAALTADGAAT
ncbi:MAG: NAD(P)-binding protein [Myxococcota bacterium]